MSCILLRLATNSVAQIMLLVGTNPRQVQSELTCVQKCMLMLDQPKFGMLLVGLHGALHKCSTINGSPALHLFLK